MSYQYITIQNGNPTIYRDKTLVWEKGSLKQYEDITYNYDASGTRLSKTKAGITTKYYYQEGKLLAQDNGNTLVFNYGANGIEGFSYEGVGEFYYKKNILKDVIGIIDSNGKK